MVFDEAKAQVPERLKQNVNVLVYISIYWYMLVYTGYIQALTGAYKYRVPCRGLQHVEALDAMVQPARTAGATINNHPRRHQLAPFACRGVDADVGDCFSGQLRMAQPARTALSIRLCC